MVTYFGAYLFILISWEPFPGPSLKEPFPSPSLKGREMRAFLQIFLEGMGDRAFSSPSPSGEGWGEALCRINEISDSADYTVP